MAGKTVVVIGAGLSGAAAAHDLAAQGFNVVVVEGRSRVGGRLCTDRHSLSVPVDLGAGWIHEAKGNPITELCKRFNVDTKKTDYDNNQLYRPDGEEASDKEENAADKLYKEVLKKAHAQRKTLPAGHDMSLGEALAAAAEEMELTQQQKLYLQYSIHVSLEHEYAAEVSRMSLKSYDEGDDFDGDDKMVMGYDALASSLLAAHPTTVLLEHIVSEVHYNADGVVVVTDKGAIAGDFAVCTLPLGVLKSGTVGFSPPLPGDKLEALLRVEVGVLNKVFLEFPKVFWEDDVEVLNYVSKQKGHWQESYNLHYYTKRPILCMFAAADFAVQMESWTDEQVVASALKVLREIEDKVPPPTRHVVTRWHMDPFARGSYSYSGVGAVQPRDRRAIAAPVGDRLFFAGEHASVLYPATAHGAYLSGVDAAKAVAHASSSR